MTLPIQITFRNIEPSKRIEAKVRPGSRQTGNVLLSDYELPGCH